MKEEFDYVEDVKMTSPIREGHWAINREDLPIVINFEGRKEYIISAALKSGGIVMTKKEA